MNILFLDDDNERWISFQKYFEGKEVNLVRAEDAPQCISLLESKVCKWDVIFLDHDLGGKAFTNEKETNTGSEVARWMAENYKEYKTPIVIHSWNPQGAEYMRGLLIDSGFYKTGRMLFANSDFKFYVNQLINW